MSPSCNTSQYPTPRYGLALWLALWLTPGMAWAADASGGAAAPKEGGAPAAAGTAAPSPAEEPGTPRLAATERVKVEIPPVSRTYEEMTSKADRERARKVFDEANKAFEQRQVDRALGLYEKSYAIWPHPRTLFNKAVSLGFLGRPLESARAFKEVLEYGPDPISEHRYRQAVERYMELLSQLAILVVNCTDAGAKLYVNGEPIGEAPMSKKVTVGPGTHMITANLSGMVPYSAQVRLGPGELKRVNISLQAFSDVVQYRMVDRYRWWVPTLVTGAAVVLVAAGAGMVVQGRKDIDTLIDQVDAWSPKTSAHVFPSSERDQGVGFQQGGYVLVGLGGAAAATAVVLWILQKKRVRYTVGAGKGGVQISF